MNYNGKNQASLSETAPLNFVIFSKEASALNQVSLYRLQSGSGIRIEKNCASVVKDDRSLVT